MDLRDSPEDADFRAGVRAWLAAEVARYGPPPKSDDWDARRAYDTGWQRILFDAGYAGLAWPEAFGGRGLPASRQLVFFEEYAAAGAPYVGVNFVGTMHAGPTLIAEGTDEQRRHHLPRILRGESVWCQGFSEPQAGSDLASLRTRAERRGDEYVVTGQKIWSTRAHVADHCELLVRTDPDAPRHKGITWLILDMHQPGVEVRPMRTIDGTRHFCEVFLDEARVPVANRVGEENDGWRVANVTLRFERGTAFAQHIVSLRSQVRRLVSLALARPAGEGPPPDLPSDRPATGPGRGGCADGSSSAPSCEAAASAPLPPGRSAWDADLGLRRRVGRLEASVEALWRMTQMCVTEAEETGVPSPLGSAVKLRYSELAQEIAELAVRLTGRRLVGAGPPPDRGMGTGIGNGRETGADLWQETVQDVVREYLWSFQSTIAAGTSQIQRNLVAERILGMPKGR